MPRISVITGYYNRCEYLERTIESILEQTFEDFELIVFDDCSTDGTAMRLQQLSERYQDSRFKYIVHEKNKGFVSGLIDAVKLSSGEFIAIQGSGDISLPQRLERQINYLDSNSDVGAVGGYVQICEEGGVAKSLHNPFPKRYSYQDIAKQSPFTHGEVMFRKTAYDEVGGYRKAFKFAQDRDLWLRMSKITDLAVIPELIYKRYTLMDGVSFVPEKVLRQKSYSIAAVRLSQIGVEESKFYSLIEENGPESLVPLSDPEVQQFIPQAALRLGIYGESDRAIQMIEKYMDPSIRRLAVKLFLKIYGTPLIKPFLEPARAIFRRIRLIISSQK